jgi:ferrous iron transport protein B
MPTLKGLLIHTWERTWQYMRKAGTVILALSILFWALMTFPMLPADRMNRFEAQRQSVLSQFPGHPQDSSYGEAESGGLTTELISAQGRIDEINQAEAQAALRYSFAGRIGLALENVSQWCGFEWRTNVALLAGFAAKELIISTLGTAYSMGETNVGEEASLTQRLAIDPQWNRLTAISLIVFIMLYAPCLVTVSCIIKETRSLKWGVFSMVFNTTVAFSVSTLIYQGGIWLGAGG